MRARAALAVAAACLFLTATASPVSAQPPGPPGQPVVHLNGDNTALITFTAPQTGGGVSWYRLRAVLNGSEVPGSPFMLYYSLSITTPVLAAGTYTVSAIAVNSQGQTEGFSTTFNVGTLAVGVPTLNTPVVSGNSISFSWTRGTGAPPAGFELAGIQLSTGLPLSITIAGPNQTSYVANRVPEGSYRVRLRAYSAYYSSTWTAWQTVVVGGTSLPGTPTLYQPVVSGSTVNVRWDPPSGGGGQTGYEIEALIQATGQTVSLAVDGSQTSLPVPGVPQGNFIVKMRAKNVLGYGPWSAERIVVVGVSLISGDLQVTLTWNTTVDMDLHVIEPNGTHVYYSRRTGTTTRLDVDDRNGYGPENIYVAPGQAAAGTYQFFIVQWGSLTAPTTSTIAVRLFPNTSSERTAIFSRTTSSGNSSVGYNVANVNLVGGSFAEATGTRSVPGDEPVGDQKRPLPDR